MKKLLFFSLSLFSSASLFAEEASAPWKVKGMFPILICGGLFAFMYLFLLRPEQKRRKKMEALQSNLSKGDQVTAAGMVGTVSQLKEKTVVIKMVEGAKIEVLKGTISEVRPSSSFESKQTEITES